MHRDDSSNSALGDLDVRRRLLATLFASATLTSTGYIAAVTVAPLVADEVLDLGPWLGVPGAVGILGTAAGSSVIARLMARRGRRIGLLVGLAVAAVGACIAVVGTATSAVLVFTVGMAALGFGNAAGHQARYAAADLFPAQQRSSVIGLVVWAATIGAVAGPALVAPAGRLAESLGRSELTGGLAAGALGFLLGTLVVWVLLRPDPTLLALPDLVDDVDVAADSADTMLQDSEAPAGVEGAAARVPPYAVVALTSMVAGHFVMVLIMSVTAIRLRQGGSGLAAVSVVLSAHILGMYALTPMVGRAADRLGDLRVIVAGMVALIAASLMAALAPADAHALLTFALFLLGLGWSGGFVAGSGMLARHGSVAERARMQGRADTYVFSTAAFASLSAGALLTSIGYSVLCLLGAIITAGALVVIWSRRATLVA